MLFKIKSKISEIFKILNKWKKIKIETNYINFAKMYALKLIKKIFK